MAGDYKTIRNELERYDKSLIEKKEYIFLTKIDLISEKKVKEKIKQLKKTNPDVLAVSIYDEESLEKVKKLLNKIKSEKMQKK